jgi:tripartite-type tricarboxylate transporter receptor subunit TctC
MLFASRCASSHIRPKAHPGKTVPAPLAICPIIAIAGLTLCAATAMAAESWPQRPVRIVTSEPGGGSDFTARVVAQGLTQSLGQQVIVDNRAGTVTAAQIMTRAAPDGYTLLSYNNSLWTLPLLQPMFYDVLRDFVPVTLATRSPNILVTHPAVPVANVRELVAYAKAHPGALNYASGTVGSTNHLAAELFKALAGVNIARVGYKGSGFAVNDLIGGQVQLMFATSGSIAPHVKSGRLRALAVTSAQPSALAPGLPTVASAGVPGYEAVTMYGLYAPAKTPATIITRLQQDAARFLRTADIREKLFGAGVETVGAAPAEFSAEIRADIARLAKVIKDANIRAE